MKKIANYLLILAETAAICTTCTLVWGIPWYAIAPSAAFALFWIHREIAARNKRRVRAEGIANAEKKRKEHEEKMRVHFERAKIAADAELAKLEALAAQNVLITCPACGHEHVVGVRMDEDTVSKCPKCSAPVKLLISIRPVVAGEIGQVGPLMMSDSRVKAIFGGEPN